MEIQARANPETATLFYGRNMHQINQALDTRNPYYRRAKRRYIKLPDDQRKEVEAGYARHVTACEKIGIAPDPTWLPEYLGDLVGGKI